MKRLLAIAFLAAACASPGAPATTVTPTNPPAVTTPEPEPAYEGGSGIITFGTAYDPDTLFIAKPLTRFKRTFPEIAWSAELARSVDATSVEWIVASQTASGSERVIIREDHDVSNPSNDLFANKIDLASLVDNKAGTYVMRYIESGEVLAEGTFTLVK